MPTTPDRERLRAEHAAAYDAIVGPLEDQLAAIARAAVRPALAAATGLSIRSLRASAAVDLSALGSIPPRWETGVQEFMPGLGKAYQTGGLSAWVAEADPGTILQDVMDPASARWMEQASNRLVGVGDDLWTDARKGLAEFIEQGADLNERTALLQDILDVSETRARTVARTEGTAALNAGTLTGATALDGLGYPMVKEWLSTRDNRTRDSHWIADGQQRPLHSAFSVGGWNLQHPGDTMGPASEVVNCRCSLLIVEDPAGEDVAAARKEQAEAEAEAAAAAAEQKAWEEEAAREEAAAAEAAAREAAEAAAASAAERAAEAEAARQEAAAALAKAQAERAAAQAKEAAEALPPPPPKPPSAARVVDVQKQMATRPRYTADDVLHGIRVPDGEAIIVRNIPANNSLAAIDHAVAYKHDGVLIVRDLTRAPQLVADLRSRTAAELRAWAQADRRISDAVATINEITPLVSKAASSNLKHLVLSDEANPADAYWAVRYKRPGFTSAATGGNNGVYVYGANSISASSLRHEFGHLVDDAAKASRHAPRLSATQPWGDVMASDATASARYGPLSVYYDGHRVTPGDPKGLTTYGSSAPVEDFAESVRLFLLDRRNGYIGYSNGSQVTFAEMFPGRARILRRLLPTPRKVKP